MAYITATVIQSFLEADGRTHLRIQYTGDAGEAPVVLPLYINQSGAVSNDFIRGEAMAQLSTLNQSATIATSMATPSVLDTTTPLPTANSAPTLMAYTAASLPFAPGVTPQDVFTIQGSATKVVTILKMGIATIQTTAGSNTWHLLKRSTANTGGTSATITAVPHKNTFSAATASVSQYTARATASGTLVGLTWTGRVPSPAPANVVSDSNIIVAVGNIILTGTGERLAWNFNGVTAPAGISIMAFAVWTEF